MTTMTFGPESGTLHLLTGVEGKAARMGHDLVLDLPDWSAEADVTDGVPTAVRLRAGLASFAVTSGTGGAKALSDKDRTTIRKNALGSLRADKHPEVTFSSTPISPSPHGFAVTGDLSIGGRTGPVTVDLAVAGSELTVRGSVVQTQFDVTPYSAMLGALRLRDRIDIAVDVTMPA